MVFIDHAALTQLPQDLCLRWQRRTLHFRTPATTSRGAMKSRDTDIITVKSGNAEGEGECCIMPGLLPDLTPADIQYWCNEVQQCKSLALPHMPSPIRFGLESALFALHSPNRPRWNTPFSRGEIGIRIHGLIWMADIDTMLTNMHKAIDSGFTCLKMKVGAHPFSLETEMLSEARQAFPNAEIRVDANGAWAPQEAYKKLEILARLGISFIEQPVKHGQWQAMAELCRYSPLPIALDEELLYRGNKTELMETIQPQGIVIKPSLHGGLIAAENLAKQAEEQGAEWWINSALESHIGLETLAEWCGLVAPDTMHGLGTGRLFADDKSNKIRLDGEYMWFK